LYSFSRADKLPAYQQPACLRHIHRPIPLCACSRRGRGVSRQVQSTHTHVLTSTLPHVHAWHVKGAGGENVTRHAYTTRRKTRSKAHTCDAENYPRRFQSRNPCWGSRSYVCSTLTPLERGGTRAGRHKRQRTCANHSVGVMTRGVGARLPASGASDTGAIQFFCGIIRAQNTAINMRPPQSRHTRGIGHTPSRSFAQQKVQLARLQEAEHLRSHRTFAFF